jgi:hypothetical protein
MVESPSADIDDVVQETQRAMREASLAVLPGFPLRTDAAIVRYPDRYRDPRGLEVWQVVEQWMQRLDDSLEGEWMEEGEVPF